MDANVKITTDTNPPEGHDLKSEELYMLRTRVYCTKCRYERITAVEYDPKTMRKMEVVKSLNPGINHLEKETE